MPAKRGPKKGSSNKKHGVKGGAGRGQGRKSNAELAKKEGAERDGRSSPSSIRRYFAEPAVAPAGTRLSSSQLGSPAAGGYEMDGVVDQRQRPAEQDNLTDMEGKMDIGDEPAGRSQSGDSSNGSLSQVGAGLWR